MQPFVEIKSDRISPLDAAHEWPQLLA